MDTKIAEKSFAGDPRRFSSSFITEGGKSDVDTLMRRTPYVK
jgi:hypothetical protein